MADKKFRLLYTRTAFYAVEVAAPTYAEARKLAEGRRLDDLLNPDDEPYLTQDDLIMVDEIKRGKVVDA